MKGLFDGVRSPARKQTRKVPKALRLGCESCGLYHEVQSPKMAPYGGGALRILNVGEGPGETEDERGRPWQGKVGRILERTYRRLGVDLFDDCVNVNAVNCRPTTGAKTKDRKNRTPTPVEIAHCRKEKVDPAIDSVKPRIIVLFGGSALQSVLAPIWEDDIGTITRWRGFTIPDRTHKAWICPVFHPSYVARSEQEIETVWVEDLRRIVGLVEEPLPKWTNEEKEVQLLESEEEAPSVLRSLLSVEELVFDIETTGLKPHDRSAHRIVSWAFSTFEGEKTFSFLHPKGERALTALRRVLRSQRIGKIAHNMKFEHAWVREILGYEVENWTWDPMQVAHITDNRTGITGLKFQTYVNFGRAGYDQSVKPFLRSIDEKNANSPNRIEELIRSDKGRRELLTYGGLDTIFTRELTRLQRARGDHRPNMYELIHDGALALVDAESAGIRVDREAGETSVRHLTRRIDRHERKFRESEVFGLMEKRYGRKANPSSTTQLAAVLYEDMGIEPLKRSEKTKRGSADEESLAQLRVQGLSSLLEARKLRKIRDTYLDGFLREACGDVLHPLFSLNLARSGRSSSSSPNFQNIPVRDDEAKNICRGILFPRPGHRLLELDYAGIEVRIAACYTKDPVLTKYILDPTTDMHLDMGSQIFKVTDPDHRTFPAHKRLRYAAKNGFVFPQFYGDYYGHCAESLAKATGLPTSGKWRRDQGLVLPDGEHLSNHLIDHGLRSYGDFEKHVQEVEDDFWKRRFRVYTKWKDRWWREYQQQGWFETFTGFRCSGVMSRNECLNYPIQGTAFHCLLWLFVRLNEERKRRRWDTQLIGQIHDSIVLDALPEEVPEVIETVRALVKRLPEEWDWLVVPLEVEEEAAGVDEPWSLKKPLDLTSTGITEGK